MDLKGGLMRNIILAVVLLFSFSLCCEKPKTKPPLSMRERLMDNARLYETKPVDWINRDSWISNDGTTKHKKSVSYDRWAVDMWFDFIEKNDLSKIPNQTSWSEYTSYHPGSRYFEPYDTFWIGTCCEGVVYRSAIESGYTINYICLNNCKFFLNEGDTIPWVEVENGDIIVMDLNNDTTDWDHVGIITERALGDSTWDEILSAMGLYSDPFWYKAGTHKMYQYDDVMPQDGIPAEPPPGGWKVYNVRYIRLHEEN